MKNLLCSLALGLIAVTPAFADDTPIMQQPEGKLYPEMSRSGMGYFFYLQATLPEQVSGMKAEIVVNEDKGEIYFLNPFSMLETKTWLKGELDAEGNVVVHTPQFIYREFSNTVVNDYYVSRMVPSGIPGDYSFLKDEEESDLHFTWKDGVLTQTDDGIMGLTFIDGEFAGYADSNIKMIPFEDVNLAPANPDELTFEDYLLGGESFHELAQSKVCKVAFDGDTVWVKDFHKDLPDAYIHGDLVNGQLIFPSKQYLGLIDGLYAYFYGATTYIDKNIFGVDENMYKLEDYLIMDTSSKNGFISDDDFYINAGCDVSKRIEVYMKPELYAFDVNLPRVPMTPQITQFNAINPEEQMMVGMFSAALDPLDEQGQFVDPNNMYYTLYLNDLEHPLTLTKRDFPNDIKENTTEIPLFFDVEPRYSTWALLNYYNEITYIFDDASVEKVGIESIYKVGDQVRKSPVVWTGVSGIDAVETEATEAAYYDLTGRRVVNPDKGIYIVKLSNGKTYKKVVR